jgi:hypothetical protein
MAASANTPSLARMVRDTGRAVLQRADDVIVRDVGPMALQLIKARTGRGVSSRGTRFPGYAPPTAKIKGRVQPVTLFETGAMLGALVFDGAKKRIGFNDRRQERKARFHEFGTRNMPPRPFVRLSLRESRQLFQRFGVGMRAVTSQNQALRLEIGV